MFVKESVKIALKLVKLVCDLGYCCVKSEI
jgi:hypothetical protein